MTIESIAMVAHEANRAYCRSIGDNSQPSWDEAPARQKASAIAGVQFQISTPFATAPESHENWMKQKTAEGWIYGPVKDPVKKEHPCMVPFKSLPIEQQIKDSLFGDIVYCLNGFGNLTL